MESEPSGAPDVSGTAAPAGLTILDALERASEEGYEASFSATDDGDLECEQGRHRVNPAAVHVERLWRVEGASDAADMNLVCALSCPRCGAAGSLVLGYGPNASAADDAVSRHLLTEGATEPGTSPRSAAPPQG